MAYVPKDSVVELKKACERIGSTPVAQARWLLGITKLPDYDALNSDQQEALQWELTAFLRRDHESKIKKRYVTNWYSKVRKGFQAFRDKLIRRQHWTVRLGKYRTAVIDYKKRILRILPPKRSERDRMAIAVYRAIVTLEGLLARCQGCNSFFIRERRQRYCNQRCGAQARLRRFREKRKIAH